MLEVIKKYLMENNTPEDRFAICKNCDQFWDAVKVCKVCKCYMPAKTKLQDSRCPLRKW